MKNILSYLFLFFALFIFSCKKVDLPDPVNGTPVFNANLNLTNGETVSWEAGVNNYYMFTDFKKDTLDVFRFIGRMEQEDCQDECVETLVIEIRDASINSQGSLNIDEALSRDLFNYYSNQITDSFIIVDDTLGSSFLINLTIDTILTNVNSFINYRWEFNGATYSSPELSQSIVSDVPPYGSSIKLTVIDSNSPQGDSCISWQQQTLVADTNADDKCAVRVFPNFDSSNFILESLSAEAVLSNGTPFFSWSNGSNENQIFGPFQPFDQYSVTMTDANDCISLAGYEFNFQNPDVVQNCSAHFNYNITELFEIIQDTIIDSTALIPLQLSTVTIIYTDKNGNEFRSDINSQTPNSNFKIIGNEDYDDNELGYPTKKLDLEFNCTLWSENENTIIIEKGTASWGIAYPK